MFHRLKYGYSSQKGSSQTNARSFPSGIYLRVTLRWFTGTRHLRITLNKHYISESVPTGIPQDGPQYNTIGNLIIFCTHSQIQTTFRFQLTHIVYDLRNQNLNFVASIPEQNGTTTINAFPWGVRTTVGKRNYFTGYGMLLHKLPVVAVLFTQRNNNEGTMKNSILHEILCKSLFRTSWLIVK